MSAVERFPHLYHGVFVVYTSQASMCSECIFWALSFEHMPEIIFRFTR